MKIAAWAGALALMSGMAVAQQTGKMDPKKMRKASMEMAAPHAVTTETYLDSAVEFAKSAYTAADATSPQKEVVDANWKELKDAVMAAETHASHVAQMIPADTQKDISRDLTEFRAELDRVKTSLATELTDPRMAKTTLQQIYPHLTAARDRFAEVAEDLNATAKEPPAPERGTQERPMQGR